MSSSDLRPPFTLETAVLKVRAAEDAWNSRDPLRVSKAYSPDTRWRYRDEFIEGRAQVVEFLEVSANVYMGDLTASQIAVGF